MGELLFLVGVIIGGLICYFFLQYKERTLKADGGGLRARLAMAEKRNQELRLQLIQCEEQGGGEKLKQLEEQVRQQAAELQDVSEKLASAEQEVATLHEQSAASGNAERPVIEETPPSQVYVEEAIQPLEKKGGAVEGVSVKESPASEKIPLAGVQATREASRISQENLSVQKGDEKKLSASEALEEVPSAEAGEGGVPSGPEERGDASSGEESIPLAEVRHEKERSLPKDDLRKIEGIGPKVASILNGAGIMTFEQLAQAEASRLRRILKEAGPSFQRMVPESWPEQADLAARGEWKALKTFQDQLDGGRYRA